MHIILKQAKGDMKANIPIEVAGYHFRKTYGCDVFSYPNGRKFGFYVPADKINSRPEYTLPNVDKYLVRDTHEDIVEVLACEATIVRRVVSA